MMLVAGVFTAEAMTGSGASGLRSAAGKFSPIETVALSRSRTCVQIRTDFGLPPAPRLLVCALLAVKVQMQKGRPPKRAVMLVRGAGLEPATPPAGAVRSPFTLAPHLLK